MRISVIFILLLLWEGTITNFIPVFQYWDELLMIIFFVIALIRIIKGRKIKLRRYESLSVILLLIYLCIGFISNYVSNILTEGDKCILSGILSTKFIIMYISCRICFRNMRIKYILLNELYKFFNIALIAYTGIVLLNSKFSFFEKFGERFGVQSVSAGFTHPSELDFFAISIMIFQLFLVEILQKNLKNYKFICLSSFIIILFAGRTKSMVFFVIYIIGIFGIKFIKRIKLKHIMIVIPIAIIIAKDRINSELIDIGSIRGTLYKVGIQIANDFFPLGSGFGTYGSEISRIIYSPLYYKYNMSNIYGFSSEHHGFLTDAQWASIIGETGWIGISIYILMIILLTLVIVKTAEGTRLKIAVSSLWIYGLLASISDTILINYRGIALVVRVTFFMSIAETLNYKEQSN